MIPKGITDKYEVVETLQKKAATAVLLVRHKRIGDLRILKVIPETDPDSQSILSEANLIAGIKSPQIPTIFDIGQTDGCYYFTEEYFSGETLEEFLIREQTISKDELLRIIIKLCDVIDTIHNSGKEPILYRDIKPEHIILQDEKICLIDFSIAVKKSESGIACNYGTKSYAAPEQLEGLTLDERCDVYGIGKILEKLILHCESNDLMRVKLIAKRATDKKKENRHNDVKLLKAELQSLQNVKNDEKEKHLSKKIVVIGMDKAVGCTHLAIKINMLLNKMGIRSIYFDESGHDTVKKISRSLKRFQLKDEILYHKYFAGYMDYGPAIQKSIPSDSVQVIDCGTDESKLFQADKVVFVISGCPWKSMESIPDWVFEENVIIISNFSNRLNTINYAKYLNKRIYEYPKSEKVFSFSRKENKLIQMIASKELGF